MLDYHFSLPRTVDRIRGLWLGPAIEQYVDLLADRRCAPCTIRTQVRVLGHFDSFATASGATSWNELPALAAPFVAHWVDKHCGAAVRPQTRSSVKAQARNAVEEILQLVVPGFVRPSRRVDATPEMLQVCNQVATIPRKRTPPPETRFMTKIEVQALFDRLADHGRLALRDRTLLLFL
jgi:hypothetical protein